MRMLLDPRLKLVVAAALVIAAILGGHGHGDPNAGW